MKQLLIIWMIFISISNCQSQANTKDKIGSWITYTGIHRISDRFSVCTLAQLWSYEVADNFNFMLLYGSLNYHITPKITTTVGYGYGDIDGGFNTNNAHTLENRVFEQIGFRNKISVLSMDYRFRIEQRFLRKLDDHKVLHRLRYRMGTKIRWNNSFFVSVNDEVLVIIQDAIILENRFYVALGIKVSKSCDVQLGYLNRNIKGANFHRLQAGVCIKTDHRKRIKTKS